MLTAGIAGLAANHLAEVLLRQAWRLKAHRDPPEDPEFSDVGWPTALLWAAGVGAIVAIAELGGRHAAEIGWRRVTGRRPPRPYRRPKDR